MFTGRHRETQVHDFRGGVGCALTQFSSIACVQSFAAGVCEILERGRSAALVPLPQHLPLSSMGSWMLRRALITRPDRNVHFPESIREGASQLEAGQMLSLSPCGWRERQTVHALVQWFGRAPVPSAVALEGLLIRACPEPGPESVKSVPYRVHVAAFPQSDQRERCLQAVGSMNGTPGTMLIPAEVMTLEEFLRLEARDGPVSVHHAVMGRIEARGLRPEDLMTPPGYFALFADGRNAGTPHAAPLGVKGRLTFELLASVDG